jgi:bacillithiol system protein YtxJ
MFWSYLTTMEELDAVEAHSHEHPCLIFKHSTRCNISHAAKYRLEHDWGHVHRQADPYFLDLLNHRDISDAIAERFKVHHESPQIVLLLKGECIYEASHLDIRIRELMEELDNLDEQKKN